MEFTNLAIVLDETTRSRFDQSRERAQDVLDSLRTPDNHIGLGHVRVRLVTSSQIKVVTGSTSGERYMFIRPVYANAYMGQRLKAVIN